MKVTYWINSGIPCDLPTTGYRVNSLKEAIQDFKNYIEECDRFGNTWENAYLEVTSDHWPESRLFEVGKRKGIKEIR